jgi:hypothetical protein
MKKTSFISISLLVSVSCIFAIVHSQKNKAEDPYITIQFGRSMWSSGTNCKPDLQFVNLQEVAKILATFNFTAQGTVPPDYIAEDETERKCFFGAVLSASWSDLKDLQQNFGWTFVSDALQG